MPQIQTDIDYCLFPTAIGACAIAWGVRGIVAVQLPAAHESHTRARLLRMLAGGARPARAPPHVRRVIDDIVALLDGQRRDLLDAVLDMNGLSAFQRRVYEITRTIAPGNTLSYGEVAARCGEAGAARAVGQALGRNPFPVIVPCHRVLAAGGRSGGFSAPGGVTTKLRLLDLEGALGALARSDKAGAHGNLALPF
ncbi:MAG TPA: methylated-DNA--[protein]-cysteine S-methyltransferase [Steroidobacteraceae bacterium]|jgi:methylated-DNA-[protein]-cysteine S-methyltransferase